MQFSYILTAATALISFVPGISANADTETGRGMRRHRNYGRYDSYDQYYGRNNAYGYDNDYNYGYDGEDKYDNNCGYNRNHGGYYRYRRNEDAVQQAAGADNTEQVKQSTVAEQSEGNRNRHYDRRSGRRHSGNYDYDYDYGYGRRRHSGRNHRNSYYYY